MEFHIFFYSIVSLILSLAAFAVRQVSFDKTMEVDACRALFQRAHKVLIEALEERAKAELQSQHSAKKRLLLAGAAVAAAPESGSSSRSSSSESGLLQTAASSVAIAQESSSVRSRSNSQEAQERQEGQGMARHGGKRRSVTFSSTATMVDLTAIDDHVDEGDDDDDDGEIEVIGDTRSGRRGGSGGSPDGRGGGGGGGAAAVKPYQLSGSLLARIVDAGRLMRERDAAGRRCDRQVG